MPLFENRRFELVGSGGNRLTLRTAEEGFTEHFMSHGVRLCANIKPCLLQDHPRFSEAAENGLLVNKPDHTPAPRPGRETTSRAGRR
jgi:alpha-glucosidase (family GH31 glycosyl hydrolase)